MIRLKRFEIFYNDLKSTVQEQLCQVFETTPEDENWNLSIMPLITLEREVREVKIMTETFAIFYDDLTKVAQFYLRSAFKTTPEEENWNIQPLVVLEREIEEDEPKQKTY